MKPDCQIIEGDCRTELAKLPEKSVHMICTSPPYWSLRKYEGVEPSVWGGHIACQHEWGSIVGKIKQTPQQDDDGHGVATGATGTRGEKPASAGRAFESNTGQFCRRCSAWRGLLGLELNVDCGQRGLLKLRADLTDAQREYVVQRLSGAVSPDAGHDDTQCKALRHSRAHSVKKDTAPTA